MKKAVVSLVLLVLLTAAAAAGYRQWVLLPHARAVISEHATNPSAAQWRNELFVGPWSTSGFYVYCAQANLPNRAGGYDGFHDVLVMADQVVVAEPNARALVAEMCGHRKQAADWWWLRW